MKFSSSGLKDKSHRVAKILFPAVYASSIDKMASIIVLFPNKSNMKHVTRLLFMFTCYMFYLIDGLLFPLVDTQLLPLPREAYGRLKHVAHVLYGCAFAELISTRIYLCIQHWKLGKENINWYALTRDINSHDRPKLFAIFRLVFFELYISAPILYFGNQVVKLFFERSLAIDVLVNVTWIMTTILLTRFTLMDMPLLYMIASSCYLQVQSKLQQLNSSVQQIDEHLDQSVVSPIVTQYKNLMKMVFDVNTLVKLLMFQNNLLVVPFISSLIVIAIAQTDNLVQVALKVSIFAPASVYTVRGIILTAILARVDFQSKILYRKIMSSIARGNIRRLQSKIRLQQIMDDLSSSRNHLLMREYTGKVTQMDVYENAVKVVQFTMLLLDFSRMLSSMSLI